MQGVTRGGLDYPPHPRTPAPPTFIAGHVALVFSQLAFGLFPIFGTVVFRPGGISPLGVGAWRVVGGSVVLGALAFGGYGRRALPRREDVARFVACALLGVAINQGLFLVGLARSTPMNAALVMVLIPVFTFVAAAAIGQEHFSVTRAAGVALALAGVLPLVFSGGLGSLSAYGLGNLLMVANAFSYSLYLIVAKPLTRRYSPVVVIAWSYLFSLVALPVPPSGASRATRAQETRA